MKKLALFLFAAACAASLHGQALDRIWLGGTGLWTDASKWSLEAVPPPGSTVKIDNNNADFNSVVTFNTSLSLAGLFISTGDTLTIENNRTLTLTGSSTFDGSLTLNSLGNATNFVIGAAAVTLSGSGVLTLGNHSANQIYGSAGTETLTNQITIQGAGALGLNLLTIANEGLILANQSTPLTVDPAAGGLANSGTMRATAGGTLQLQNGAFTNTSGGVIKADDDSHVDFSAAAITGGTLTSIADGHFHVFAGSSFSNLTISSGTNIEVGNNNSLNLSGAIANDGTIKLLSEGNSTNIIASSNVTLSGNGEILLSNNANNRIYGSAATTTLVNESNTISGAGQIGLDLLVLDNRAVVRANISGATLELSPGTSAASTLNTGTFQATSGGILRIENGTVVNTGGTLLADAGSKIDLSSAEITGGTLTTTSTGLIRSVSGTNTLSGALTLSSGSRLEVLNNTSIALPAAGTFTNNGTVALTSGGNLTTLIISGGTTTLAGAGTIDLSNDFNNRILGGGGADRLVLNADGTILGAGQIGVNLMGLTNEGIVKATRTTNLVIDPSAAGVTNTGLLRAEAGATLHLQNGTFTNTNGEIEAFGTGSIVKLDGVTVTGGDLRSNSGAVLQNTSSSTFSGVKLVGGTNFTILNNTSATFTGTLDNFATVNLTSGGNLTNFIVGAGDLTLQGGGAIVLGNDFNNRIYAADSTHKLLNLDNTISGAGQIGVNLMGLVNSATIKATQPTTSLAIDPSAAGVVNTGLLRAETGSTLHLQNGAFTNTNGEIEAFGTGAIVKFDTVVVTGGELRSNSGAVLQNTSTSTFNDVTIVAGSTFNILNNTTATFTGTLNNLARVDLVSGGNLTNFLIDGGDLTLQGGGTVALGNDASNRIYATNAAYRLLNVDHTISGSGQIGVNLMGLVNSDTIIANQSTALTIDPSAAGATNTGVLRAEAGATLALQNGTFTNTGGTIEAFDAKSRVTFDGVTVVGGELKSGIGATLRNTSTSSYTDITFHPGSTFQILNNTTANFLNELNNIATIQLSSGGNLTNFVVTGGDLDLYGGGTIELGNDASNRIYANDAAHLLINRDNTIRGSGQIGVNLMGLVNEATVKANQSTPLVIDPSAAGVTNTGLLRAESGATLELQNGTFTNTSGTIEAFGTGSKVNFNGATVLNGDLISASGGTLRHTGNSTFSDVTLGEGATFEILNNTTATFSGRIYNSGTIKLQSGGNLTNILIGAGGATLEDFGFVTLSNDSSNRIYGVDATTTLTNENWISGSGQIGVNQLRLFNTGVIEANQSVPLTVDLSHAAGTPFNNQGTLLATSGGNLVFADALQNAGVIAVDSGSTFTAQSTLTQTGGFILLAGGTVAAASTTIASESGLLGHGTINGAVTSGGFIAPIDFELFNDFEQPSFDTVGTLAFTGPLTLQASSQLHFEIGGATIHDRIQAQSLTLAGTIGVAFAHGFESSVLASQTFTLLSTTNANGLSGIFASLPNGARLFTYDGFGSFQINYLANSVVLSNFAPVPEPSTYALFAVGLLGIGWLLQRRKR